LQKRHLKILPYTVYWNEFVNRSPERYTKAQTYEAVRQLNKSR